MGSQRNTGAFIVGGVLGGIVGAAIALWKTPQSGPELRASFSGGERHGAVTYRDEATSGGTAERRYANPVLGFVEKAAAPIVGVELGKLAKDHPESYAAPVRTSAADARPPGTTEVTEPLGAVDRATGDAFAAESPENEATYDPVEGSHAHAATTEDLVSPTEEYIEELAEEQKSAQPGAIGDFHFRDVPKDDDQSR